VSNVFELKNVCRAQKEKQKRTANKMCTNIKTHGTLFFYRVFFLPCAVENAHDKAPLCRAPENMRMTKIEMHGNHRFFR
jgi:hypothetical protein